MKKLFAVLATVSALALAPAAFAAEPMQLSNQQMDTVTAGAVSGALITLIATAMGGEQAVTNTVAAATITQAPVTIHTTVGNITVNAGTVLTAGFSLSSN